MSTEPILGANSRRNQSGNSNADPKPPVIVIVGPTASGKTQLANDLAVRLPVEIVNADSRAFYRGMDIGTAKPTVADRARSPHHLIDIFDPDEPMSLSRFQRMALERIANIHERRRVPVLTGGTAQYVHAVVEGWRIPEVAPNHPRRLELEREAGEVGVERILRRLRAVDPAAAEKTGLNLRRIVRALEVFETTGVPFSQLQGKADVPFQAIEFELWLPREELYTRIDQRVDAQIAAGLVDEVRGLLDRGYAPDLPAFSSIGYRQLIPAIVSGGDLDVAVARIKLDTHRLVRHQQTWFRKNERLTRIDMTAANPLEQMLAKAEDACRAFLKSS